MFTLLTLPTQFWVWGNARPDNSSNHLRVYPNRCFCGFLTPLGPEIQQIRSRPIPVTTEPKRPARLPDRFRELGIPAIFDPADTLVLRSVDKAGGGKRRHKKSQLPSTTAADRDGGYMRGV